MFELKCKDVRLDNLTTRTEKHGDEDKPAASLKCSIDVSNQVLEQFAPGLLTALYEQKEKDQAELIKNDMFPDLRFHHLKPIAFELELEGYRFLVVNNLDHAHNDFIIADVTLKNFKFELKDGGSVHMSFTINCEPSPEAVAYFYKQQKHEVLITLEAPEQAQVNELGEALEAA